MNYNIPPNLTTVCLIYWSYSTAMECIRMLVSALVKIA